MRVGTFYVYLLVMNIQVLGEIRHKVCWSYNNLFSRGTLLYLPVSIGIL